jgi:hypothetical protein
MNKQMTTDHMDFQYLFALGMKRRLPELLVCWDGPVIDVGSSGKYAVPGAVPLGPPNWMFPRDPIPHPDDSVGMVHAYHFLEHLSSEHAVAFLREVERVLIPERGVFSFSMPYFSSILMAQNLDHKSYWCEETFQNLFEDDAYAHEHGGPTPWRLRVHFLVIAGLVNRNLALVGQIIKSDRPRSDDRRTWYYPKEEDHG